MKSLAKLSLLLFAGIAPAVAQEPPPGDGPRGSSQLASGEARYDAVGYAASAGLSGIGAASSALPAGSYAEVTALASGRTIVVAILAGDVAPGRVIALSAGAATALGMVGDAFAVRVRKVTPTPQDVVQLRDGGAASFRAEAPLALLVALRKKLPPMPHALASRPSDPASKTIPLPQPKPATKTPTASAKSPIAKPTPLAKVPPARPTPTPTSVAKVPVAAPAIGYVVQVAALSSAERAAVVAKAVGGVVIAGPPIWRVRLGPYTDSAAANRAKAEAARKGYPGGQITRNP